MPPEKVVFARMLRSHAKGGDPKGKSHPLLHKAGHLQRDPISFRRFTCCFLLHSLVQQMLFHLRQLTQRAFYD